MSRFLPGREFGRVDFQRHQRNLRNRDHDHDDSIPSLSSRPSSPPSPSPPSSTRSTTPDELVGDGPSEGTNAESTLDRLKSEFLARKKDLKSAEGLVFVSPPQLSDTSLPPLTPSTIDSSRSDINAGAYSLDYGRRANQPLLEHLQWLQDITSLLDSLSLSQPMRIHRKELLRMIENEFNRVDAMRAAEWQRQFEQQSRARALLREGKVIVIDTGEDFFSWNPFCFPNIMFFSKILHLLYL